MKHKCKSLVIVALLILNFGCATNSNKNIPSTLMSGNISGLLTPEEDSNLSTQALMGLSSANTIKRYVSASELSECKVIYNTYISLTNFPLDKDEGRKYAEIVSDLLKASKKVEYIEVKDLQKADCGAFAAFSLKPANKNNEVILETVVYIFNNKSALNSQAKGVDRFIQSGIWSITTRKTVQLNEIPPKSDLAKYLAPYFESMVMPISSKLLISMGS